MTTSTATRTTAPRVRPEQVEVVVELPDLDDAHEVLAFARQRRAVAQATEAEVLVAATIWADLNPAESITTPPG